MWIIFYLVFAVIDDFPSYRWYATLNFSVPIEVTTNYIKVTTYYVKKIPNLSFLLTRSLQYTVLYNILFSIRSKDSQIYSWIVNVYVYLNVIANFNNMILKWTIMKEKLWFFKLYIYFWLIDLSLKYLEISSLYVCVCKTVSGSVWGINKKSCHFGGGEWKSKEGTYYPLFYIFLSRHFYCLPFLYPNIFTLLDVLSENSYFSTFPDIFDKKEKDLALKEYQSLETTNKHLKAQVSLSDVIEIFKLCVTLVCVGSILIQENQCHLPFCRSPSQQTLKWRRRKLLLSPSHLWLR